MSIMDTVCEVMSIMDTVCEVMSIMDTVGGGHVNNGYCL